MSKEKKNNNSKGLFLKKLPVKRDGCKEAARYNNDDMLDSIESSKKEFAKRLTSLRMRKEVSAREMSLSLGKTANYINSIESGSNLPSMEAFFEICEYLGISPKEFFLYTDTCRKLLEELMKTAETMDDKKIGVLLNLLKTFEGSSL